jgi:hypothetical protein
VLAELVKAERLSEGFRDKLLTWHHSGFSVYGAQVVLPDEGERVLHLARYATRPPLAQQRVQQHDERTYLLRTAPDPATGATQLALDPLELIHRLAQALRMRWLQRRARSGALVSGGETATGSSPATVVDRNVLEALGLMPIERARSFVQPKKS